MTEVHRTRSIFERAAYAMATVAALVLVACTLNAARHGPERSATIKRVGVISVAAQELYRQYTGFTTFENEFEKVDISRWKIDDEYELQIEQALAKIGGFEVKRVGAERLRLTSIYDVSGSSNTPASRRPNWRAVQEKLKAIATRNTLDALLVVTSRESEDFLAGTDQRLRGAGFYARGVGTSTRISVLHLFATVALIDGRTGLPIETPPLARTADGWSGSIARAAPVMNMSAELSRSKLNALGDAQAGDVRRQLIELPKDAWEPTLQALFPR